MRSIAQGRYSFNPCAGNDNNVAIFWVFSVTVNRQYGGLVDNYSCATMVLAINSEVRNMDIIVVLALITTAVCLLLPGMMAWNHYFGGKRETVKKTKAIGTTKSVTTGNI